MTEPIDFTHCERVPNRAYNGANGKKIAVRYDGDIWLVKFPPSLAHIAPRIDLAAITAFIDGVPFLTDLQRQFYKVYLTARYEALLV